MKKIIKLFMAALLFSILFASMLGGQSATALVQPSTQVRWEALVKLHPDASRLAAEDHSVWADPLRGLGVSAGLANDWLSLKGQKDMAQISAALFDTSAPLLDFLGGSVELTIYLPSNGKPLTLNLEARNTTGYIWEVLPGDGVYLESAEPTFAMRYRGMGAPAIQTIRLSAMKTGDTSVRLIYHRPFEAASEPHARLDIWMTGAVDAIDLSDPTPAVFVDEESSNGGEANAYAELDAIEVTLPTSWDWRTQGIVPAVRDQGGCGSCWAFGTVGVMESAVKKGGGPLTDLSEQFLVSCNTSGYSCSGGLTTTTYHYNRLGRNQTQIGAVLESAKPYIAINGTCTVALAHPYKASSWAFVTGSEWIMPTVDQIKNAIYTYGPVTAGVCADSGWNYYSGGVYNPTSNRCGGYTNHQIVLVGWDDATSSWILRNSWGAGWGEAGYMRIRWDATGTKSRVGEGTSWVKYVGVPVVVSTLVAPVGTITNTTPTFTWSKVTNATKYRFQVMMGDALLYTNTVSSTACGTTNCTSTPATVLSLADHKWRAQAYVGGVWKTYSAYKAFTVSTVTSGFVSSFNGSSRGWVPVKGAWNIYKSAYYYSAGSPNVMVSSRHIGSFDNMTYEVKMKRSGICVGCANSIIIRGNPAKLDSYYSWKPSYLFQYTNDGYFSVYEVTSTGGYVALADWTSSSAILKNSWNTLKVVADGSALKFYINGTLVWSGTDTTLTTGTLGLGFYRDAYAGTLYVDWSNLGVVVPAAADPIEVVAPGLEVPGGSVHKSP